MKKENRKNNASLYINGKMEYQAVNLEKEYGQLLDGCKYAIASYHCEETLINLYKEELDEFRPFIYLTVDEYEAIYRYQKNEKKYENRYSRKHDVYEYDNELTAVFHEIKSGEKESSMDPLEIIIREEENCEECMLLEKLGKALACLSEIQRNRIKKYFFENKSFLEIAEEEGCGLSTVYESVIAADYFDVALKGREHILLCSDGLTNMVSDKEILSILKSADSIEDRATRLVELANSYGGKDNISVIIVE